MSDVGLRLSEGIQELKLDQQLAPTREAISRTLTAGSTNVMKAMEGLRGRWLSPRTVRAIPVTAASSSDGSAGSASTSSSTDEVSKPANSTPSRPPSVRGPSEPSQRGSGLRPLSLSLSAAPPIPQQPPPPLPEAGRFGGWVGSFFTPRPASSRSSTASSIRRESSSAASVSESTRGPSPPPVHARDSVSNASIASSMRSDVPGPRIVDDVFGGQDNEAQKTEPAGTGVAL